MDTGRGGTDTARGRGGGAVGRTDPSAPHRPPPPRSGLSGGTGAGGSGERLPPEKTYAEPEAEEHPVDAAARARAPPPGAVVAAARGGGWLCWRRRPRLRSYRSGGEGLAEPGAGEKGGRTDPEAEVAAAATSRLGRSGG